MIQQQIYAKRLIEINAQISGKNAEKIDVANIEAQFETK